jgi:hypothetical protein
MSNVQNSSSRAGLASDMQLIYPNLGPIAQELGVRHLLEGTVSRSRDQIRVSLRLVDASGAQPKGNRAIPRARRESAVAFTAPIDAGEK